MSVVSGQLVQTKISAGSVASFGQSLRTFVPEFQVCPVRPAFDYVGRSASPDSLDTQTCPGAYPASLRIDVENSLRPYISPTYFNLPVGISGGADTMFGNISTGRPTAFGFDVDINVPMTYSGKAGNNEATLSAYAQKYTGNASATPVYGPNGYRPQPRVDMNN